MRYMLGQNEITKTYNFVSNEFMYFFHQGDSFFLEKKEGKESS